MVFHTLPFKGLGQNYYFFLNVLFDLFDQKYSRNNNVVKDYYNLNYIKIY